MTSNAGKIAIAAVAVATWIGFTSPAHAITDPVDLLTHGYQSLKKSVRSGIAALFGGAVAAEEAVTPPTPSDVLAQIAGGEHSSVFVGFLKDAGYDLAAWDASIGIIPETNFTFQLVRELSEADRDWLQQELEVDALRRRGLLAKIQRRFVQTLLDASEFQDLRVGKVVIGILPLPYLQAEVQPTAAPLSEEHDTIYRELKKQTGQLKGKIGGRTENR